VPHLPSRTRSLVWVACAIPVLERAGCAMPSRQEVVDFLSLRLPGLGDDPGEECSGRDDVAVGQYLSRSRSGAW